MNGVWKVTLELDRKGARLGKAWADKEVLEAGKIIRLKKLRKLGGSLVLVLPKVWVEFMCKLEEDGYWVEVRVNKNQIIITGYKGK